MAQDDEAVLVAAVGYVFVNDTPGAAAPTPAQLKTINLENPASWSVPGWRSVGHTSAGDLPEFGFEGGKSEMRRSWQKKKLRNVSTEDPIDFLTVFLQQFDENGLGLYYGENSSNTPGVFGVKGSNSAEANEKAVLVIIEDGDFRLGHRVPKADIKRDDAIQLPIDDLASLPIRCTYLDHNNEDLFQWINEDLFNVSASPEVYKLDLNGATAGTYVLKVGGTDTAAIAYNANAASIKAAIALVDDGHAASEWTVVLNGSDFDISGPVAVTLGTDTTTGGTGLTVTEV